MRNGQNNKHRMRGRNRSGGKSHNPLTRVYESNGPDVKIRGTANHVAEKYIQLARDATASGDPVAAENYYQHAEHYFRLIAAAQEQFRQTQPFSRPEGGEQRGGGEESYDEGDNSQPAYGSMEPHTPRDQQQFQPREQQGYQQREQRDQPYQQRDYQQGNYQPRENRDNRDNRDNREGRNENRQFDNRRDDRQQQNRQHDNRQYDRQPQQNNNSAPQEEDLGLPSFITGAPPQAEQPNGHEGQGDRFPLHRRRRRGHRGGRPDMAGGADQGGDEGTQGQPPANE